jgi:hypothetical protein
MEIEGLREAVRRQPFKPFTMRLSDGRGMPVPHPEFLAIGPNVVILVTQNDSWMEIDPFMIVSLDYEAGRGRKAGKSGGK